MIPTWADSWIGLEYADRGRGPAYDCWGLAKTVLASHGIPAPDYLDEYRTSEDMHSVADAMGRCLARDWTRVAGDAKELDIVILNIAGRPWHCGVMLNAEQFLHSPPPAKSVQHLSGIEAVTDPQWERRVAGYWRWAQ